MIPPREYFVKCRENEMQIDFPILLRNDALLYSIFITDSEQWTARNQSELRIIQV